MVFKDCYRPMKVATATKGAVFDLGTRITSRFGILFLYSFLRWNSETLEELGCSSVWTEAYSMLFHVLPHLILEIRNPWGSVPFTTGFLRQVTPELGFEFHYFFTRKFWMAFKVAVEQIPWTTQIPKSR